MKQRLQGKSFVVVGSGITGLSLADAIVREGGTVRVIEQNRPGAMMAARYHAASPRAFAQLLAGSLADGPGRVLAEEAYPLWQALANEAKLSSTAFNPCGWLACATGLGRGPLEWYYENSGKRWGVHPLEKAALRSEPRFRPFADTETVYALFDPKAASVYPPVCLNEFASYLSEKKGVKIRHDARVLSIQGRTAIVDVAGVMEEVNADGFFICTGNYRDIFPAEYTSRGFTLRVLQMTRSKVLNAEPALSVCATGDTTITRYGFTGGAPTLKDLMDSIHADLRRIDANVLFSPHPMQGGTVISFGDTHAEETDHITFNPHDFEILRREAKRFVAEPFIPSLADLEQCYVGMYPYFADQGPFAENPVMFVKLDERAICIMPTKGRGWTVAPALARRAIEMWIQTY